MKILYANIVNYNKLVDNNINVFIIIYILFIHTYHITSYNDMKVLALTLSNLYI